MTLVSLADRSHVRRATLLIVVAGLCIASLSGCATNKRPTSASRKATPAQPTQATNSSDSAPRTYGRFDALNDTTGPGGNVELDTLNPTKADAYRERNPYQGPTPSVVSIDRSNWQETRFVVPVSGVNHHPHYTDEKPRFARQTARARGEYPTQATVLEMGNHKFTDQGGSLALEGVAAPIRAMWDILKFPVVATRRGNRPFSVVQSPIASDAYARGPAHRSQWAGQQAQLKKSITGTPVPGAKPTTPADPQGPLAPPPPETATPSMNPTHSQPPAVPAAVPPEQAAPPSQPTPAPANPPSTPPGATPPERAGTPGSFKPKGNPPPSK
jgi:hypothetical protein